MHYQKKPENFFDSFPLIRSPVWFLLFFFFVTSSADTSHFVRFGGMTMESITRREIKPIYTAAHVELQQR